MLICFGFGNFLFHLDEGEVEWSVADAAKSVAATCRFYARVKLRSKAHGVSIAFDECSGKIKVDADDVLVGTRAKELRA